MLKPVFALHSKYLSPYSAALASACYLVTYLCSRSDLFPSSTVTHFSPIFWLHKSIHSGKLLKLFSSAFNKTDTTDIKHQKRNVRLFQVVRNQRPESLLASCIPELKAEHLPTRHNRFGHEVNSNCWLYQRWSTPMPISNLSSMKRVKIEVFPVDCSPRNTTLILLFKLLIFYDYKLINLLLGGLTATIQNKN